MAYYSFNCTVRRTRPVTLDDLLQATGKSESTIRSYLSQLGARVGKHGNNCYSPLTGSIKAVLKQ